MIKTRDNYAVWIDTENLHRLVRDFALKALPLSNGTSYHCMEQMRETAETLITARAERVPDWFLIVAYAVHSGRLSADNADAFQRIEALPLNERRRLDIAAVIRHG
jgi:hypothetical protein